MRMFIGMIFGCLLTIGAVYVHDSMATPGTEGMKVGSANTIVNWDVAAREWGYIKETAHTAWLKLQAVNGRLSKSGDA